MDAAAWLGVALLAGGIWFAVDSLRARETATAAARERCRSRELQFLDGTVALASVRIVRSAGTLSLRRVYQFDFAHNGVSRHRGQVVMRGQTIERLILDPAGRDI